MTKTSFSKRDISILLGNALEHFDSALYGFLAPIVAPIFFPNHDIVIQLILAYSFMATSIVTRPLGAFIFGIIARKYGPLISMSYSLKGVAIFGVIIGLIPNYEQIGSYSAILLLLLRFIKGIFASGENAIVKLYILEHKNNTEAFKASYTYQASSMIGTIFASITSAFILWVNRPDLWRYCFILSGILYFAAYKMRYFNSTKSDKLLFQYYEISIFKSFRKYKIEMLSIAFTTGLSHMTYVIPFIVMNSLMPLISNVTITEMMELNTILLILDMLMIFMIGPFLIRFDYRKVIKYSTIAMVISFPVLIFFLESSNIWYISFVRIWIVFLGVVFMCPQNLYYKKLFENNKEQYILVGIANAIGAGIIGKTIPAVTMWLWYITKEVQYIGLYMSVIAMFSYYTIAYLHNR